MNEDSNELVKNIRNKPKVAIVVINWNSLDDITECIKSLQATDYPNYEIVVVDNASTDGSPERIAEVFPNIILLKNKVNLGYGSGANVGMKYAVENGCSYIFLFSPDAVMTPDALGKLVAVAEKKPQIGLLAPALYYYHTPTKLQYCGSTVDWDQFTKRKLKDLNEWKTVNRNNFWLWATAVLLKCDVIRKIGYFNEEYFVYCEDLEYSLKANKEDFDVEILPSVHIYHKAHSIDIGGTANLPPHWFFYITRNEYWFWRENISGFKRITLLRKYLAKIFDQIGHCKAKGQNKAIDACLAGLYCSFRNISGEWDKSIKMPKSISKIITLCPFFWADFLEGRFRKIFTSACKKSKKGQKTQHV